VGGAYEPRAIPRQHHIRRVNAPPPDVLLLCREPLTGIRGRFGDRVVIVVEACTDADTHPKPCWRERKERYLEHLRQAPREARLIVLADKLHNARAILPDHRAVGERVWERFNVPKQATLWYYRALADAFAPLEPGQLTAEFGRVVAELEEAARAARGGRTVPPLGNCLP